jgi:hypothetical protein
MTRKTSVPLDSEWPHRIDIDSLGPKPFSTEFAASARQCKDVARRLKASAVEDLRATVTITRRPGSHIIQVEGAVEATVTQACAVSGEPLVTEIAESFEAWYSDEAQVVSLDRARREREVLIAEGEIPLAEEKDDPEPVVNGQIDVGELAVQYLSLAVDPYVRKPGVADKKEEVIVHRENSFQNPFAALKDWKTKDNGKKT